MKRPKKLTLWYRIEKVKSPYVDWNGKPTCEYIIKIPYWLGRAYSRGRLPYVQISFYDKSLSAFERLKRETGNLCNRFFKENYARKSMKMRKLNNGYMEIESSYIKGKN